MYTGELVLTAIKALVDEIHRLVPPSSEIAVHPRLRVALRS
jgi:hypothetical protein